MSEKRRTTSSKANWMRFGCVSNWKIKQILNANALNIIMTIIIRITLIMSHSSISECTLQRILMDTQDSKQKKKMKEQLIEIISYTLYFTCVMSVCLPFCVHSSSYNLDFKSMKQKESKKRFFKYRSLRIYEFNVY